VRILVVSQWFPPEPGGGPARFLEMAKVWLDLGHDVQVIAGMPNWPTGRIHDDYRRRLSVRERYDGVPVVRTPVLRTRNEGAMRRLANHGSFVLSGSVAGLRTAGRPDVVIATSPPLFAPLAGLLVARRHRIPFVLDVRDLWPDAIFALSDMDSRPVRGGLQYLERMLYRRSSAVVVVTEGFAQPVRDRGAARVETIPNGVDLETFAPGPPDPSVRRNLGSDDELILLYAGTLGLAHGLDTVLEAARRLAGTRARFVFAGEGADRPRLEELAAAMGLGNVTFLPLQPRERMPDLYRAADVCLASLRPAELFNVTIPSKIFEIMGSGRPIVAAVDGEAADIVRRSGAGVVAKPGSVEALEGSVRTFLDSPDLDRMGAAGRRFVEGAFDRRALAIRYESLIAELAVGTTPSI